MTLAPLAWQLCLRHRIAFLALGLWFIAPWLAASASGDLALALPFSWMGSIPFAIYTYRATSGSQLLGILPLTRREVWQITCLVGALAPVLVQFGVAVAMWALAYAAFPVYAGTHGAGLDTLALGAAYSLVVLHLVLVATASLRRHRPVIAALAIAALGTLVWFTEALPSRVSEFTASSALVFWTTAVLAIVVIRLPGSLATRVPARSHSYRLTFDDLPGMGLLDRLTGVKRILLVHTLFGFMLFSVALGLMVVLDVWFGRATLAGAVADELRMFRSDGEWVMRPGASALFTPMWVIGFANIWTPMVRQLRVLPLTSRGANAIFLAFPIAMWVALWVLYLITYILVVGGPVTLRLELFLAISGSSTVASVISLRWKNRLYGMFGVAFVYGFWFVASVADMVLGLTEARIPLLVIGVVFYSAAIAINHHTLMHATSASAAYQRQPKFFDTPARS